MRCKSVAQAKQSCGCSLHCSDKSTMFFVGVCCFCVCVSVYVNCVACCFYLCLPKVIFDVLLSSLRFLFVVFPIFIDYMFLYRVVPRCCPPFVLSLSLFCRGVSFSCVDGARPCVA